MYGSTVDRATFYHDFNDQRGYTLLSIVQHGNSAIAALEKLRTVQSVAVTATESTQGYPRWAVNLTVSSLATNGTKRRLARNMIKKSGPRNSRNSHQPFFFLYRTADKREVDVSVSASLSVEICKSHRPQTSSPPFLPTPVAQASPPVD